MTVHRHLEKSGHGVIKLLNNKILVHQVDDSLDPAFHPAFTVDDSTSPVPGLENSKEFSIGFRSGEWGGRKMWLMLFSWRKAVAERA